MHALVPCPSCSRHVRAAESSCPFCASTLPVQVVGPRAAAPKRVGRLALLGAGAFAVGACIFDPGTATPLYGMPGEPPPARDAGADVADDADDAADAADAADDADDASPDAGVDETDADADADA
jgi:hypothetical protein